MEHPRVLWAAPVDQRPDSVHRWTLHEASTEAEALETVRRFEGTDVELDAVVAAPDLPDGDGASVLVAARERWSDAACFLHGDLWAVPTGSAIPVCEFHPESQTVSAVVGAVADAVRRRYHRPYPVFEDEPRRLDVVEALDIEGARPELDAVVSETAGSLDADLSLLSVVEDRTVRIVAASEGDGYAPIRRGDSPCAYALCEPGPTVIDDLAVDERLGHVEPGPASEHRSYVGHPLWVAGVPVAVLCALDDATASFAEAGPGERPPYVRRAEQVLEGTL